jgi:hypothetical protein
VRREDFKNELGGRRLNDVMQNKETELACNHSFQAHLGFVSHFHLHTFIILLIPTAGARGSEKKTRELYKGVGTNICFFVRMRQPIYPRISLANRSRFEILLIRFYCILRQSAWFHLKEDYATKYSKAFQMGSIL